MDGKSYEITSRFCTNERADLWHVPRPDELVVEDPVRYPGPSLSDPSVSRLVHPRISTLALLEGQVRLCSSSLW